MTTRSGRKIPRIPEIFFHRFKLGFIAIHVESIVFDPRHGGGSTLTPWRNNFITVEYHSVGQLLGYSKFVFRVARGGSDGGEGGGRGEVNGESEGREMFLINHSYSITRGGEGEEGL